ncbi:hypothetical protein MMC25_003136 [Agyrium rufum]|nr:hypothetical protein [Agyrium rufum]
MDRPVTVISGSHDGHALYSDLPRSTLPLAPDRTSSPAAYQDIVRQQRQIFTRSAHRSAHLNKIAMVVEHMLSAEDLIYPPYDGSTHSLERNLQSMSLSDATFSDATDNSVSDYERGSAPKLTTSLMEGGRVSWSSAGSAPAQRVEKSIRMRKRRRHGINSSERH